MGGSFLLQRDRGLLSRFPGRGYELSRIEAIGPVVAVLLGRVTAPPDWRRADRPSLRSDGASHTCEYLYTAQAVQCPPPYKEKPEPPAMGVEPVVSVEC